MINDEDEDLRDESDDDYIPPPPPDDYEDPNPRAMAPQPMLALVPAPAPVEAPVVPITKVVTTECSKCKHVVKPYYRECPKCEGDRNRDRVDAMARAVREIKEMALTGETNPERERQLMKELRTFDHPDIEGLLRWCQSAREKAASGGKTPRKKQW